MQRRMIIAAAVAACIIGGGCQITRTITLRSELERPAKTGPIIVYANDSSLYKLRTYVLLDSSLRGAGTIEKSGKSAQFDGEIPFASIAGIKARSTSLLKGLAPIAALGLFSAAFISASATEGNSGLSARENVVYHSPYSGDGSGHSCPYIYAWNGEHYILEAEPFGVAIGKSLELTTRHILPSARGEAGVVRLRLTNERLETHYVNSIGLMAIEADKSSVVALDGEGAAWPITASHSPFAATEKNGRNILHEIGEVDGKMWECDATSLAHGSGYEDVLDLGFVRPHGSVAGSLVITAINTELSTAVFGYVCRIMGDQTMLLTHAIDSDPELIDQIKRSLHFASLKASVWNGREWETAGTFPPEANAVSFTRVLRVRIPDDAGDTVRVRLRSMADVWKLDAVSMDWTPASPLPMRSLRLLSAVGPDGQDMRPHLASDDARYAILFPPDKVDITFEPVKAGHGKKVVYAVIGRGYLHEWIPEEDTGGVGSLAAMVPKAQRIEFLKQLLRHREIALAPVYDEWARKRK